MNRGFTLIEVVTTLIIIGVLVAIATTRFIATSTISVRAAAEMIQADIRYTQEAAMTNNAAQSINFVASASSYVVGSEIRELPSGVTITVGHLFTFDSLGEPTVGGGQSVSVSDGTNTSIITVVDYTGKVGTS
jgi:prepilin-type N-terminal cleavage/methylation domain-containing protein